MQPLISTTYLAQIAPQRSTQYAALASTLAPVELTMSPLGPNIREILPRYFGGQSYLQLELTEPHDAPLPELLGSLAMTTAFFKLHERIGEAVGPFLEPLEIDSSRHQPPELITTRRYRGKTNELFTHWLCNIVKFNSAFAATPWQELTLLDPLAGGGTSLFVALVLGAKCVAGIEQDSKNGKSTATFLKKFAEEHQISVKTKEERLKKLGRRWTVLLGRPQPMLNGCSYMTNGSDSENEVTNTQAEKGHKRSNRADKQCFIWATGDAAHARELLAGVKPNLIVADLPYGIQHHGILIDLLRRSLPVWETMLRKGGVIGLAWDGTRFSRPEMLALLKGISQLQVLTGAPYDTLEHRVDRVIKRRDVVLLRA